MNEKRVVVVGGGFSGTSFAIQLSRNLESPAQIFIVEPRAQVGQGVAFSSNHPDHRINGTYNSHFLDPNGRDDFLKWFDDGGGLERDPEAKHASGGIFVRRGDFGTFVHEQLHKCQNGNPSGSSIRHVQSWAQDIQETDNGFEISLENGEILGADFVVLATGNERPSVPQPFNGSIQQHPSFYADPWDISQLGKIDPGQHILIVGAALTAADVIIMLLGNGHTGPITAISRRGLRPARRPESGGALPQPLWDRVSRPVTLFVEKHGPQNRIMDIFRALRADITAAEGNGNPWHPAVDDLRDSVRDVWPPLPIPEKQRFVRHLLSWYDAHRFRLPPQLEDRLDDAEKSGQLEFKTARIEEAITDGKGICVSMRERSKAVSEDFRFDGVINCTGPSRRPELTSNPIIRALLAQGLARAHPSGLGFDVDQIGRAISANDKPHPKLLFLGALTLGALGTPITAMFIATHIWRILPDLVSTLESTTLEQA